MERRSVLVILVLVTILVAFAMSIAYLICYCCRKKRKDGGEDEESLQGILADGNSSTKDTNSVKSHNGVINLKAPLMKTKSMG